MEFEKTSVELFGITILEPVTTFTDLIISAVCLYAFLKIHRRGDKKPVFLFFKYYFFTMALATVYGGIIGHGFLYLFGFAWKFPGWAISMVSVALIERAAIMHAMPLMNARVGNFFSVMNIVELFILLGITLYTLNFFFVEAHAFYGLMLVVASFELFIYLKTKDRGSRILLAAVLISALAATVHLTKFSLHKWFNYFDLSHIIMAAAGYVFCLGVIRTKVYKKEQSN